MRRREARLLLSTKRSQSIVVETCLTFPASPQEMIVYTFATATSAQSSLEPSLCLRRLSSLPDSLPQSVQSLDCCIPVDAGVGNTLTVGQSSGTFGGDLLLTFDKVGFDHDSKDVARVFVTGRELGGDGFDDSDLVCVFLFRVAVRTVDHDSCGKTRGGEFGRHRSDVLGRVVGSSVGTTEDDVAGIVSVCLDNSTDALFGYGEEDVLRRGGFDGINGNGDASVCTIFESDGHRQTRAQLAVDLGLGGSCADCTPRDEVGSVLGRDGVEEFGSGGKTEIVDFEKEASGETETLVDLE